MFDRAIANAPPPSERVILKPPDGPLIGRLSIPRLHISVMVNEGVGADTLGVAAGHIPSTGRPGIPGNIGLAAHRDTLFRNLKDVHKDDDITLTTLEGSYSYRVEWFRIVNPAEVWVLQPMASEEMLTLVTCYPFNYIGPAPKRFVVRARRVFIEAQADSVRFRPQPRALPSLT
jgi:sortase A